MSIQLSAIQGWKLNHKFLIFFAKMDGWAIITEMNSTTPVSEESIHKKTPSLWKSILLLVVFVFAAVILFGAIIYLFISGAQQFDMPPGAYIVIFVVISGIFAWLVKRITDIVSGMSHRWFPEEVDSEQ